MQVIRVLIRYLIFLLPFTRRPCGITSFIILENISNKITTNIYCPKESTKRLMEHYIILKNYNSIHVPKRYYNVIGLEPSYLLEVKLNKQNVIVQSFYSDHTVMTLSYGLLKKEKVKR